MKLLLYLLFLFIHRRKMNQNLKFINFNFHFMFLIQYFLNFYFIILMCLASSYGEYARYEQLNEIHQNILHTFLFFEMHIFDGNYVHI